MLTAKEKEIARSSKFLNGESEYWGTSCDGMCPIGAVAIERGVRFNSCTTPYGYVGYSPDFQDDVNQKLFMATEKDVCDWLGFSKTDDFFNALEAEKEKIFNRATY